jgi:hypothetical protein
MHCAAHRANHELDLVVTTIEANAADRVTAIGEAKWNNARVGINQLERLEHIRALLPADDGAEPPLLLLFSREGFTADLTAAARGRADVQLIDLERLYHGS